MISGLSCHAFRSKYSPYHHSLSPHLLSWTHVLPSALPCHTLSSDCSLPAISQLCSPPSPCLWLPMLLSTTLVYFLSLWRTAHILVFSNSSEAKQKWHNQLKKPQARCVVASCLSAVSNVFCCKPGSLAWPKCNQPKATGQAQRHMTYTSVSTGQKTAGGIQNFSDKSRE